MKIMLTSWMSQDRIRRARQMLRNAAYGARSNDELVAIHEGIACLEDAQPEYLMNLIPQDHLDRIAAVKMLTESEI